MPALASSFRDPSGFVYSQQGKLFRQINSCYFKQYQHFMDSGLYSELVDNESIVMHEESPTSSEKFKVIIPKLVPFISYPYEWCFSQLQQAALLTLDITARAHKFGMTLKDASAYNIQFIGNKPVFIDTLSFDFRQKDSPWIAYGQFCRHFLGPLCLMAMTDTRLGCLSQRYIDGLPVDLVYKLLPMRAKLRMGVFMHLGMHSAAQNMDDSPKSHKTVKISEHAYLGLLDSLKCMIEKLSWKQPKTVWGDYYEVKSNYGEVSLTEKEKIVTEFASKCGGGDLALDLGANTGVFSRAISKSFDNVVSADFDVVAVERNYRINKKESAENILPLLLDLTNPSPSIGWSNKEREAFFERKKPDLVLALALVHHLSLGANVPLPSVAEFFKKICSRLIIEWVPPEDPQAQKIIDSRTQVHLGYDIDTFESEFQKHFRVVEKQSVADTGRTMYLFNSR